MATRREIENLLKNVSITIGIREVVYALDSSDSAENLIENRSIEAYLLENAKYINLKKLLLVITENLKDLSTRFIGVSKKLEEENRKELEKAIAFSKRYIKPDESINIYLPIGEQNILCNSRELIYGQKVENKNEKYDKIKEIVPELEKEEQKEALNNALEDEYLADRVFEKFVNSELLDNQGYSIEGLKKLYDDEEHKTFEIPKGIMNLVNNESLNAYLNDFLEQNKGFINADKYLLFHAMRMNKKLESHEEITEDEFEFLHQLEELVKDMDSNTKIRIDKKRFYTKKDVNTFLSRFNLEQRRYYTTEELEKGEVLLTQINGYENYCSKEELRKLAQIEENLLYLAQTKKLSDGNIYSIAINYPVSENTLLGLYQCGAFDLKKVEAYAKQNGMNVEEIKEKIKQQKFKDNENMNLKDEETWELLTPEERLQMTVESIEDGKEDTLQGRIEELYDIQEIADLYKEIYHEDEQSEEQKEELQEKRKKYENLIKLHNALGMQDRDDIVNLLEEDLSNEMLMNLYGDYVISMDILESYGEKELVMEAFHQGRLHERDIKEAIMRYPIPLEEQQIYEYYQEGTFTSRNILDLYIQNRINLDTIKRINENLPEEQKIDLELKEEELANLYQASKKERNHKNMDLDTILKYKRYGLLYQTLVRANLDESEKIQSDKKILEHMTDVTQEDIMELYKDNLLTLETVLEYGKDELVKKLTLQGDLRTNDARTYFESEKEKVSIEEILQNPNMDETEKLILIYTTYGNNKEKREGLIDYLSAYTKDIQGESTIQRGEGKGKESDRKTITDPYERWRLFTLLDKDYSRKYVGGYLIVKLHNTQKVIIEKMYEKTKGKNVSAYGTATFVMDTDEYEQIEDELIRDKVYNIAKVRKLAKENPERITKITHHPPVLDEEGNEKTSWGKRLLESVCGEELENIYTEEEIMEIEDCMREIEESRQELDR